MFGGDDLRDLKTIRQEKAETMLSVARKSDITEGYYSMIENGMRRPSVEVAKRIAAVLGFDWTRFFEEK